MTTVAHEINRAEILTGSAPVERIVREPERALITGMPRMTWWELELEGKVPRRFKITKRAVGWRLSELLEWVEATARGEDWKAA